MERAPILLVAAAMCLSGCGDSPADPGFDLVCTVPSDEVFSGGVARDGIPALTNPEVVPAAQGTFLADNERVLGLEVNGAARAYPFTVLWWHEVANDTLGGEPVLVTYCPLTGSGIAFDPRVDGDVKNFGVSGLLWRSNLTMFDRSSESLWNQMLLAGMCGLERGKALARVPVVETTWGQWKALHPLTSIVTENTGHDRPYGLYPYGSYDEPHNGDIGFLSRPTRMRISDLRPPKELVLGIHEGAAVALYPFGVLAGKGNAVVVNDAVAGRPVLVTYVASERAARAFDRRVGGDTLTFEVAAESPFTFVDGETGSTWNTGGVAVAGPLAGTRLESVTDAYVAFWFAWSIYFTDLDLRL